MREAAKGGELPWARWEEPVLTHCLLLSPTVKECVQNLDQEDDQEKLVAALWGAERCLRVLESVSLGHGRSSDPGPAQDSGA